MVKGKLTSPGRKDAKPAGGLRFPCAFALFAPLRENRPSFPQSFASEGLE